MNVARTDLRVLPEHLGQLIIRPSPEAASKRLKPGGVHNWTSNFVQIWRNPHANKNPAFFPDP